MGEIADMMLDGTMDPETGEWNFEGEDGPGFPMTGAEAAEFQRATRWSHKGPHGSNPRNARRRAAKRARKAKAASQ